MNYAAYLDTDHWYSMRRHALEDAGWCCEFCGFEPVEAIARWYQDAELWEWRLARLPLGLHVHHLTYEGVPYWETPEDLIVLCAGCHADLHENQKRADEIAAFASRRRRVTCPGYA